MQAVPTTLRLWQGYLWPSTQTMMKPDFFFFEEKAALAKIVGHNFFHLILQDGGSFYFCLHFIFTSTSESEIFYFQKRKNSKCHKFAPNTNIINVLEKIF